MEPAEQTEGVRIPRGIIPGKLVRVTGESVRVDVPHQDGAHEPRIDLVRDGDVIQAIDVTCGCGRKIRLKCLY